MPIAYWCVLVAALLPLALARYARFGARDNDAPRDDAAQLTGKRRRAYAAHQNAFESFPFFAVAVIAALSFDASTTTLNALALLYLACRIAFGLLYIADKPNWRSAAYAAGLFINIAIFVLPALR